MTNILNYPVTLAASAFVVLWLSVCAGAYFRKERGLEPDAKSSYTIILTATLTLLSLIIGFSFSMSISRYDQRKNYEEDEANAIGTEYIRADLLSAPDSARIRALLSKYLEQRILFYQTTDSQQLRQNDVATSDTGAELWSAVEVPATAQPTPVAALVVSGMNDVLNTRGRTQAAWWNRIPSAAWALMMIMAVFCNVLIGFGARSSEAKILIYLVLPFILSTAFYLVADIDSPRGGNIRINPDNLMSLSNSLQTN
jgi:hypothetical protein